MVREADEQLDEARAEADHACRMLIAVRDALGVSSGLIGQSVRDLRAHADAVRAAAGSRDDESVVALVTSYREAAFKLREERQKLDEVVGRLTRELATARDGLNGAARFIAAMGERR